MIVGGLVLFLGIVVLAIAIASLPLLIVLARRSRPRWRPLLEAYGLLFGLAGCVALVFAPNLAAMQDLSHPAHVRGIVTDRHLTVIESPSTGGSDNVPVYAIVVDRRAFRVSPDGYDVARVGSCVTVTYGRGSGYVFDVRGCGAH